ncbi:MAG: sigma-70 family RNA polymerase sigma factor [Desulfobacteraceae bacterium]|nr:sigma-70 family RNA polymerase sigma factor [Desulfobacteraceae bacterium]
MDSDAQTNESIDLVQRIKSGDRSAETILYEKFKARLLYFVNKKLYQYTGSMGAETSEDICQDAWIAVLENIRKGYLDKPEKLPSYIYQVFSNKVIDAAKRMQNEKPIRISENQMACPAPEGKQEMEPTQMKRFTKVWRRLRSRERRILHLRYIHFWSHSQIAQMIGMSEENCRKTLQRAKERFRREFEKID